MVRDNELMHLRIFMSSLQLGLLNFLYQISFLFQLLNHWTILHVVTPMGYRVKL